MGDQFQGKVPVNKIIPFSAVDGPGNRTAVFVQGCNFNCRYCHNPETRSLCRSCGECVEKCPKQALYIENGKVLFHPELCCGCDTCIKTCRFDASPRIRYMNAQEVYQEICRQVPFIRGITVSGGECTLYPEFLQELFTLCKKDGLGTLADSNGTLDFSKYPKLLAQLDGVMLDIKAWSEKDHLAVTDQSNDMVVRNMKYLAEQGKLYEVRTVVVPGLFDCEETVCQVAALAARYLEKGDIRYKIIKYRPMGVRGEYAHYQVPDQELMEHLAKRARECGMKTVLVV